MRITARLLIATAMVISTVCDPGYCRTDSTKAEPSGSISGRSVDALTKAPVIGASVMIVATERGAATDENGRFTIKNVPVGAYNVAVSSVAYAPKTFTDVIVRSGRITFLQMELHQIALEIEGTVVRGSFFEEDPAEPTGSIGFSGEEVRRSPGSAGDVSRIVSILPSIAKVNDQMNSLVVRGGTPTENGFHLDNIEIPNINHYPLAGSSGGPIGLLNVDFVRDVTFSAGAFSAAYGDRLSSVMEIEFREGNRKEFDGQLDLHLAGFGGAFEGPIAGGRGSWMLSVRRSFLDLLVQAIATGVAPKYSDYQGKLVYDLSPVHQLTLLGVAGVDEIEFTKEDSEDQGNAVYGWWDGYEYAVGVNWRYLFGRHGYANTSVAVLGTRYKGKWYESANDGDLVDENSLERSLQLRNVNVYQVGAYDHLEFGLEGKYLFNDYDAWVAAYTNAIGDPLPPLVMDTKVESPKVGLFASYTTRPLSRLTATGGLRFDYFEYNGRSHLSPRLSFTYHLSDRTSLNSATGIYHQNLPAGLLAQRDGNRELKNALAHHYVLGISHLIGQSTKLTIDTYYKSYDHFPMDPAQPQLFVADELVYRGFFGNYEDLKDNGEARSYGVELTLQKKLVAGIYGLLSGAWFRSEYKGLDNVWRDRVLDNQVVFGVEGGYKPNNRWEYSLRWIFAGGPPYTPLDIELSRLINRSVLDRNRVNEERHQDYHSMNLRVDRRFHWTSSSLILYLSVWNVYNRQNVYSLYWNEIEGREDVIYQWSILPVFGLEFEF